MLTSQAYVPEQRYPLPLSSPTEIEADSISCDAGLSGSTPEDEMAVFPEFLKKIRKRMAPYGVKLPLFDHPRLGKV